MTETPCPLTVIITAYHEAATIGRAIEALLPQLPPGAELLVVCPDAETATAALAYQARFPALRHIADRQQGKPAALNLGLAEARGVLVAFSDGDVCVDRDALAPLLAPFADPQVGAATGCPVSSSPRDTCLGYWSHLLTDSAHAARAARAAAGDFLLCSGYLFAARRAVLPPIPADALAEDAVISHRIAEQGYRIAYAPEARVLVKYPTTYRDWLRQKVRSAGGYAQDYVRRSPYQMRSAGRELREGARLALAYPRALREWIWTGLLFAARAQLWTLVFIEVRLLRRPLTALWKRVESTK